MAEEIEILYSDSIEVVQAGSKPVHIKLTEQGPSGPAGPMGNITPELTALRDEVRVAKSATQANVTATNAAQTAAQTAASNAADSATAANKSRTEAQAAQKFAEDSAAQALASKNAAEVAEVDILAHRADTLAFKNAAEKSANDAKVSSDVAKTAEVAAKTSEEDASASAIAAALSETVAKQATQSALSHRDAAAASKTLAENAASKALASEVAAASSAKSAGLSSTDAENSLIGVQAAANSAGLARDDAQAAANTAIERAKFADDARIEAVSARADAEGHQLLAEAARDDAEDYAIRAEEAADRAHLFDPSSYPQKKNNGSDFDDPNAVRENISAQKKLDTASEAEVDDGTLTEERNWTPALVKRAIQAHSVTPDHTHTTDDITDFASKMVKKADLDSPNFTGTPTAPTAADEDNSQKVATTAFVKAALDRLIGGAPGTLDTIQELAQALGEDPNFATTVMNELAGKADISHEHDLTDVQGLIEALAALAPKVSPELTGEPTAATPSLTDNSDRIATTRHVKDVLSNAGLSAEGHGHVMSDIDGLSDALNLKANLNSPGLTGNPTAPTQTAGDRTKRLATTEFVQRELDGLGETKADASHAHEVSDIQLNEGTLLGRKAAGKGEAEEISISDFAPASMFPSKVVVSDQYEVDLSYFGFTSFPSDERTYFVGISRLGDQIFQAPVTVGAISNADGMEDMVVPLSDMHGRLSSSDAADDDDHFVVNQRMLNRRVALPSSASMPIDKSDYLPTTTRDGQAFSTSYTRVCEPADKATRDASLPQEGVVPRYTEYGSLWVGTPQGENDAAPYKYITQINQALERTLSLSGGTMTGKLGTAASTAQRASINVPNGVAPTAPANGDIWAASNELQVRLNGATRTIWHDGTFASFNATQKEKVCADLGLDANKFKTRSLEAGGVHIASADAANYDANDFEAGFNGLVATQVANTPNATGINFWHIECQKLYQSASGARLQTAVAYINNLAAEPIIMFRICANDTAKTWTAWRELSVAGHKHAIADVTNLQSTLNDKAPLASPTFTGSARIADNLRFQVSSLPGNYNQGIKGGNGDAATSTTNNLRIESWYGIGLGPTSSSGTVPVEEYSHWFNVRNGDMGMRGTLTAAGNIEAYSDIRLKSDVATITDALSKVNSMRGVTYTMNGKRGVGVIAQEVQAVIPEVVSEGDDDDKTLAVAYGNLVGLLIEAIKELKAEIDELKRAV